jgi:heptosyltransferase-2
VKILLIQYQMLGDVLTSTIIADQLKLIYPTSHIDYLIVSHAEALVRHHPAIDGLIEVKKSDFEKMSVVVSLSRKLKQNNYDLLIDAYGKNNSALLSFLSGAKQRIGYKKWFSPIAYTQAVKNSPDTDIYKTGVSLGSRMLLTAPLTEDVQWHLKPKIYLIEEEKKDGLQWIIAAGVDPERKLTMVSALGSGENKTLPFPEMAKVLDHFVALSASQLLFNYIPSQKEDALAIYKLCQPETQKHIFIDAFAPSIRDFLKVLSHCTAIIGNEGGAINMGKALDVPTFTIFSPWINKSSWNVGEDGRKHISVHLKDFKPDLYHGQLPKQMKSQAMELYREFKAPMMLGDLEKFVEGNY